MLNAKGFIGNPTLVSEFVKVIIPNGAFTTETLSELAETVRNFIDYPVDAAGEPMTGVDLSGLREVLEALREEFVKRSGTFRLELAEGNAPCVPTLGAALPSVGADLHTGTPVAFPGWPNVKGEVLAESGVYALVKLTRAEGADPLADFFPGIYRFAITSSPSKPASPFGPPPTVYEIADGVTLSPCELAGAFSALSFIAVASLEEKVLENLMEAGAEPEPGADYDTATAEFLLPNEPLGRGIDRYEAAEYGPGINEAVSQFALALRIPARSVLPVTLAVGAMLRSYGFDLTGAKAKAAVRLLEGGSNEDGTLAATATDSAMCRALRSFAEVSRAVKPR